ncbi:hypothetical protein G6F68_014362 [Rhizopus microsporus]|nr:hypothetical protein G6F68_014362 [Rhizopus microsporus]
MVAHGVYATKLAETTQNFLLAAQQELAYAATRLGQDDLDPQRAQDEASRLQLQTNSFNSSLVVDADGLRRQQRGTGGTPADDQRSVPIGHRQAAGVAVAPDLQPPGPLPRLRQRDPVPAPAQRTAYAAGQALLPRRFLPVRGRPSWSPALSRRWQAGR